MLIGVPGEKFPGENRVALIPAQITKLTELGARVQVEPGSGLGSGITDEEFTAAGAEIQPDRELILAESDLILRVRKPPFYEISQLRENSIHISYLDPYFEPDLISELCRNSITAISMEMIPRTTRAQKMDALSSQANLAGYVMVLLGCERLPRILPMMMTPAGTIKPANVFVIGAGVAGLQAIATAKRLGARVTAFDTRSVTAEQVRSLGAKFLDIDLGPTGETKDGYAVQLSPRQLEIQKQAQMEQIAKSDLVITTAQLFGRKPPVLISKDVFPKMQRGSVIVDMAAENGGNVEGSVPGQTVEIDGVWIIGQGNWPNYVPRDASQMYSANIYNLIEEFWDTEKHEFSPDFSDEIINGCVITHRGEIVNDAIRKHIAENS